MTRIVQITHPTAAKISHIIEEEKKPVFTIPSEPNLYNNCSMVDVSKLSIASLANKIATGNAVFFILDSEEENE